MNIKTIALAALVTLLLKPCTVISAAPPYIAPVVNESRWYQLIQQYIPPTVASSLIGIGTSYSLHFIEQKLKLSTENDALIILALWYLEYLARHTIISNLERDLDHLHIPHRNNLMRFGAWLSSWITYVNLYDNKSFHISLKR